MTREDLARTVLLTVAERCEEAMTAPKPKVWRWDIERWEAAREWGPLYSTVQWFRDLAGDEAGRVRCLRMVQRFRADGLVEIVASPGNRMERVRLTANGWNAVAELRAVV